MNYRAHYDRLMFRARGRVLVGYRERHHVLPRCMGGTDAKDNLVELTPEEHYVAHQLLVKLYPSHEGLSYAAVCMAQKASGRRAYGWLRGRYGSLLRGKAKTAEHRRNISTGQRGRPVSLATRARIAASLLGRSMSEKARQRMSAVRQGRKRGPMSEAHRAKLSAARTGWRQSEEQKARISASLRGRQKTPEHQAKITAALRARAQASGSLL